jgi:hypothetical protein
MGTAVVGLKLMGSVPTIHKMVVSNLGEACAAEKCDDQKKGNYFSVNQPHNFENTVYR